MKHVRLFVSLCIIFVSISAFSQSDKIPQVTLKTLKGDNFDSAQLNDKDHPVIVSFWATWCGPCLKELDAINDLYIDWQDEFGVELYAVSEDDSRTAKRVKPMVNGKAWDYKILLDENQDLKRKMNINNIPYLVVVYKGKIVYKHTSYSPGSENELYRELQKLN